MFGQHKVELFGETLMNFNILLSYKGSAVLSLCLAGPRCFVICLPKLVLQLPNAVQTHGAARCALSTSMSTVSSATLPGDVSGSAGSSTDTSAPSEMFSHAAMAQVNGTKRPFNQFKPI